MNDPTFRIAVVGGGITGLAAAHRLTELAGQTGAPLRVSLYEAGDRLGGSLLTRRHGDYLVEYGADSFITNKPEAVDLCRRIGLESDVVGTDSRFRKTLILSDGRAAPVPEGFQLLTPGSVRSLVRTPLLSLRGKMRAGLELFIKRRPEDVDDETLASFVCRRFGPELFERIAQPMVGGIYTADPERLSLRATLPRFLDMERRHGSLIRALRKEPAAPSSGARYGLFASLRSGLGSLVEVLAKRIQGPHEVRMGSPVTALDRRDGQWVLGSGTNEARADAVLVTTSAWASSSLVAGVEPSLAEHLAGIEYASSAVVCTGHRLNDFDHPMDAFGIVLPQRERWPILAVSFSSRKYDDRAAPGSILLRTFLGGALHPELADAADDQLIGHTTESLRKLFGMRGTPELTIVQRWRRAMPQYHLGHVDRVDAIERLVAGISGLELAGNAYRGVGIPDCIRSAERAAERLFATTTGLPAPDAGPPG